MFILFLIATFFKFQSYGLSLPIIHDVIDAREPLQSGPVVADTHKLRTRTDIIWSCVSTLFICTWVAIHPNIPPREGPIRSLWRRVKLMLWTLLVPELILLWAYKQWAAARYIAEFFKDEDWTPMHGHFLIMGGFVLVDGEHESVLNFDDFRHLLGMKILDTWGEPKSRLAGRISFPTITNNEICDKARGDFLSKAIAIMQSLWFIVQCVARGKEGFALTELELVTVALASLTGVMYFFWWDKPLGVKEPIKLYPKGKEPAEKMLEGESENTRREQRIQDSSQRNLIQKFVSPCQQLRSYLLEQFGGFRTFLSSSYGLLSSSNINQFLKDQRDDLDEDIPAINHLWFLYLLLYWFIGMHIESLFNALSAIGDTHKFESGKPRVPTFYAPHLSNSIDTENLLFFVLAPIAVVFGALHCIAWNFQFPTYIERLLWHIGSLTITLIPAIPLILLVIISPFLLLELLGDKYNFELSMPSAWLPKVVKKFLQAIMIAIGGFLLGAGLFGYMLARLLLVVQAAMLLRKQPESAFYAINWLNFFPHI